MISISISIFWYDSIEQKIHKVEAILREHVWFIKALLSMRYGCFDMRAKCERVSDTMVQNSLDALCSREHRHVLASGFICAYSGCIALSE